jgi:DNA polymerase-4
MTNPSLIAHVDINSYFATLLQQENPHLRNRPMGVTKAEGRTCLIAVSKEAKKFGVITGSRLREARLLCPQILPVPADFDRYLDATYRLKQVFNSIAPQVYIYSLDEAFIEISECLPHVYRDVNQAVTHIADAIKAELGEWVTCSIGVARTRFLAKMASDQAPKDGSLIITDENQDEILARVGFESVCGIGFRLSAKLATIGVTHPYQIRFYSHADLVPLVGDFWAGQLRRMAYGDEPHLLQLIDRELPHMKSVSRSITGYRLYHKRSEIESILINLIEEVTHKLRRMKLSGRQVSVALSGHGRYFSPHRTLPTTLRTTREMWWIAKQLLEHFWADPFPIIKFEVRLSLLEREVKGAQSLFTLDNTPTDATRSPDELITAVDELNERYGLFTVRPGSLLRQEIIRPEVTGFLGDRTYYGL